MYNLAQMSDHRIKSIKDKQISFTFCNDKLIWSFRFFPENLNNDKLI